jgi:hypothetical protein
VMRERNSPWAMLGKQNSPPHQVEWGVRPECEGEDLLTTTYFSEQNELLSIDLSMLVGVFINMLLVNKSYLKYTFRERAGPTAKGLREDAGNTNALPGRRTIHKSFGSEYPAVVIMVRAGRKQRHVAAHSLLGSASEACDRCIAGLTDCLAVELV